MEWTEQPTEGEIEQRIALSKSVVSNVIVWILEINDDDDRRKRELENEHKNLGFNWTSVISVVLSVRLLFDLRDFSNHNS